MFGEETTMPKSHNVIKVATMLLGCFVFPEALWAAEKLEIAAFEFPPIYQNSRDKGLSGDIVIAAFKAVDVDAELRFFPPARMILSVSSGQSHCGIGGAVLFEDPETAKNVRIGSVIQYVAQTFLYDRRKYPKGISFGHLGQLQNHTIGVLFSSGIMKLLQKNEELVLSPNSSHEGLAKQLHAGRIDLWATVDLTGHFYLKKHFPEEAGFFEHTMSFNKGDVSLVCSTKTDPDGTYIRRFAEGLNRIKKNGTYLQIMSKYYGGILKINQDALPPDVKSPA